MKYIRYTLFIIGVTLLQNCSDSVLEEDSRSQIFADQLYSEASGFDIGLNGLYAQVRREFSDQTFGNVNGMLKEMMVSGTDNMYSMYPAGATRVYNEWGNRNDPTVSLFTDTFAWLYQVVNGANTIIGRVENPAIDWEAGQKERVLGEAHFFRAWAYRHLTYLFGDVPLSLEESTGSNIKTDWARTPMAEIRQQMIEDFQFAADNLSYEPPIEGKFSKAIAMHYLAETYLAMKDYDNAALVANELITDSKSPHKLITERYGTKMSEPGTPFTDMFIDGNIKKSQGNTEALWVVENEINVSGGDGLNLLRRWFVNRYYSIRDAGVQQLEFSEKNGGRGIGRVAITKFGLDLYGPNDDRGGPYAYRYFYLADVKSPNFDVGDTIFMDVDRPEPSPITSESSSATRYLWPSTTKWDYFNPVDPLESQGYKDVAYVRLAETYLILAEAQLFQGNAAAAAATINVLRERAGASEITAADVDLDFILDERSRELWSEEHRRYTLLRTGKWLERVKLGNVTAGPVVTERDELYPIPQNVIDANLDKVFPQNPGF